MTQRKLTRSGDSRVVAGVCGGIAEYFEIDVTIVRLLTVAASMLSAGIVLGAYVVCWLILPDGQTGHCGADTLYDRYGDYRERRAARERAQQPPTDSFRADD